MRKKLLPLIVLPCLASCAPTIRSEPTPAPTANPCRVIPLPDVSQATRNKLADEVDGAPVGAVWPGAVQQWIALRAAVRACRGAS